MKITDKLIFFIYILRFIVFLGFAYMWLSWTALTLVFSDDGVLDYLDYIVGFVVNMGIFIALFPIKNFFIFIPAIPIIFTSYLYFNTLLFGDSWKEETIGLTTNLLAIILIILMQIIQKQ